MIPGNMSARGWAIIGDAAVLGFAIRVAGKAQESISQKNKNDALRAARVSPPAVKPETPEQFKARTGK